ncbi:MAG: 2-oxoglutarate dehydrogenase E1 subunit family protein, partial [Actinomycetes bacterium]
MTGFGTNEWLVEEMYQQYVADPSSVDQAWHEFFADYRPGSPVTGGEHETTGANGQAAPATGRPSAPAATPQRTAPAAPAVAPAPAARTRPCS